MKKKLFALLTFIFVVSLVLLACDPIRLNGVPKASAKVYGNGGSAVVKDNYVYFANSYIDYDDLGINDNKYEASSGQVIHAIYRTTLNEFGKLNLDDDDKPQNVELVTYCIGGYAYSGLYICGDYLYYSTPYSSANNDGGVNKGNVRFERVKLDGTGREVIHNCTTYSSDSSDYEIVHVEGVTYIVILESNGNLMSIACRGGNIKKNVLASGVTSFSVYEQHDIVIGAPVSNFYSYAYYIVKDSNSKNNLYRKSLSNNAEAQLILGLVDEDMSLISVKNERLYFLQDSKLYSYSFVGGAFEKKQYASSKTSSSDSGSIVSYLPLDDNNIEAGILGIYYDGSNYSFKVYNGVGVMFDTGLSYTSSPTLYATKDGDIYYSVSDTLYVTSLSFNGSSITASSPVTICESFSTNGSGKAKFDFDNDRIFVFAQVKSSSLSYLTMYMINSPYLDDDGNIVGHYMGQLSSADATAIAED